MTDTPHFPQIERLIQVCNAVRVGIDDFESLARSSGNSVLFFAGDPARYPESIDMAVILPEIAEAFPGNFRIMLVGEDAEKPLQAKFGFSVWPALVFLRDGDYVGVMTGAYNWDDCLREVDGLLQAPTSRPPGIGLPIIVEAPTAVEVK